MLHGLAHVPPLRDFFVEPDNYKESKSALVRQKYGRWGHEMRKLVRASQFPLEAGVKTISHLLAGNRYLCVLFGMESTSAPFVNYATDQIHDTHDHAMINVEREMENVRLC